MHRRATTSVRTDVAQRLLDLTVAISTLVLFSPVLLALAFLVRATSPGPVLFRQRRIGAGGRPFEMFKFRTMTDECSDDLHRSYVTGLLKGEAEQQDGLYKLGGDPRITPLGRTLRRFSLDELPQLINVVRGEMSLVGPRPALPWEIDLFPPTALRRLEVRPGMTGLWQVEGRNRLPMNEGLELDVRYVERRTVWVDIWLLVRTPFAVFGRGAR